MMLCPSHPHSAYLEMLLDSGVAGLAVALALYMGVVLTAAKLMRNAGSPLIRAVASAAMAVVGTLLVQGLSGQSLFPKEGMMGLWCTAGLLIRTATTPECYLASQPLAAGTCAPSTYVPFSRGDGVVPTRAKAFHDYSG